MRSRYNEPSHYISSIPITLSDLTSVQNQLCCVKSILPFYPSIKGDHAPSLLETRRKTKSKTRHIPACAVLCSCEPLIISYQPSAKRRKCYPQTLLPLPLFQRLPHLSSLRAVCNKHTPPTEYTFHCFGHFLKTRFRPFLLNESCDAEIVLSSVEKDSEEINSNGYWFDIKCCRPRISVDTFTEGP